jgi:hypothetical protein
MCIHPSAVPKSPPINVQTLLGWPANTPFPPVPPAQTTNAGTQTDAVSHFFDVAYT